MEELISSINASIKCVSRIVTEHALGITTDISVVACSFEASVIIRREELWRAISNKILFRIRSKHPCSSIFDKAMLLLRRKKQGMLVNDEWNLL